MKRCLIAVPVLAVTVVVGARAQTDQAYSPRAEDVATLDGIITAAYEVVSGPAGGVPDRARDLYLHRTGALVRIAGIDADGRPVLRSMTIEEYHERLATPRNRGFYEWEIHRQVQRFGNIAHVWSTYAASETPRGEPHTRGINSLQLFHDGDRWWILGWAFDSERAGNPIPREFLP